MVSRFRGNDRRRDGDDGKTFFGECGKKGSQAFQGFTPRMVVLGAISDASGRSGSFAFIAPGFDFLAGQAV
jgi:hypothetical protein